jgi:hypothetical protein
VAYLTKANTERRILARASARPCAGSNAQNSQLLLPGGLPTVGVFTLPKCSNLSGMSGAGPQLDQRLGPWDGVWRARCPHLRSRSSSDDVPDNVSGSHTAAGPFPGPRHVSRPDVPDNRPLSNNSARVGHGRPAPVVGVRPWAPRPAGLISRTTARARCGGPSASPMRKAEDRLPFRLLLAPRAVWRHDARWRRCWRE